MRVSRRLAAAGAVGALALSAGLAAAGSANAESLPVPSVFFSAVTHVVNDRDTGADGAWADVDFTRTITVSADTAAVVVAGQTAYSAAVSDKGTFVTIKGAATPNGFVPGLTEANSVKGTFSGSANYVFYAPDGDVPAEGNVATSVDDHGVKPTTGPDSTNQWYLQAFPAAEQAAVTADTAARSAGIVDNWSWTYSTGCEKWVDSAADNDGQNAADGNITGKICVSAAAVPYVYAGREVSASATRGEASWKESAPAAPWDEAANFGQGKCEEVWISGPGFGAWDPSDPTNPGTAHVGFTCDHSGTNTNTGYLAGLQSNSTYALRIVPATGTYGDHAPIPRAKVGYVDIFTS